MKKYFYPAIFTPEDIGYSVRIPDLDGCFAEGDTLEEAYTLSKDAIGLYLSETRGEINFKKASPPDSFQLEKGDFVVLIEFDKIDYLKRHENRAVKKTLTIPQWLNDAAEDKNINFSRTLKDALMEQLNIEG